MRIKNTVAASGLAFALSAATLAGADCDARGQLSEPDFNFVKETLSNGMSQIDVGNLAKQKGITQVVRDFGDRMVNEHKKANEQLRDIASKKGATLLSDVSYGESSTAERLKKLSGPEFDKAYSSAIVSRHREDLKDLKTAVPTLKDPDLKAFAQQMIPALDEHLRAAQDMEKTVYNR